MIQVPPFKPLHKGEFLHLLKQHIDICAPYTLAPPIDEALQGLATALQPLEGRLSKWRREPLTKEVEAFDKQRDNALSGLHLMADACTRHYDPAIAEAGKTIIRGMRRFGKKLTHLNYMAKTTVIEALVSLMTTAEDPMAEAAERIPLTKDWVRELERANLAFENTWLERLEQRAARPDKTFTELRPGVASAHALLCQRITAQQTLYPSNEMAQLIAELNELTEGYKKLVRERERGFMNSEE